MSRASSPAYDYSFFSFRGRNDDESSTVYVGAGPAPSGPRCVYHRGRKPFFDMPVLFYQTSVFPKCRKIPPEAVKLSRHHRCYVKPLRYPSGDTFRSVAISWKRSDVRLPSHALRFCRRVSLPNSNWPFRSDESHSPALHCDGGSRLIRSFCQTLPDLKNPLVPAQPRRGERSPEETIVQVFVMRFGVLDLVLLLTFP